MKNIKPVFVTQPSLPPLKEYIPYLEKIWDSKVLTNGGQFHRQLEDELCEYLGVEYISLFTNGTIALITALQALDITGEVITTPYSFVATSNALLWNNFTPVFVDIDPETFNVDVAKIEAAINSNTVAIMPVHCYGNPCAVEQIQQIAEKYNLRVIYDAAHAFGVKYKDQSLLKYGDLSVLSFHATKVFNTFEGGAIVSSDSETKKKIDNLKNFGFINEVGVIAAGINGKMSELNSAFGLLQLKYIQDELEKRGVVDKLYRNSLSNIKGISIPSLNINATANFSYFPILVEDEYPISRDELYEKLKSNEYYSRRYFYPLISNFPMYSSLKSAHQSNLPIANNIADKILCLPIYSNLSHEHIHDLCELIGAV
jgi:dTDP-4-amino-4,6-dideoxygalactose transaminase